MKKITLLFAFSIVSLIGYAQKSNESTTTISESLEREIEYIIVLDDEIVDENIDMLLNGSNIMENIKMDFHAHELAHDAPEPIDIESKFIDGAYSYNEYAVNYSSAQFFEPYMGS
jgi:hypothetical protein